MCRADILLARISSGARKGLNLMGTTNLSRKSTRKPAEVNLSRIEGNLIRTARVDFDGLANVGRLSGKEPSDRVGLN